jgi:hypothetical protein
VSTKEQERDELRHFVIIYDVETAEVEIEVFGGHRYGDAIAYFRSLEWEVAHDVERRDHTRVLLFSADSEEALRVTHGHYFAGRATRVEDEAWDEPLTGVLR